ncbi:hypothetical protein GGR88_001967 [Sphingomonas jejuensis]|uniref:Uncharacterized protein n=1 Tax=Sphingomonas jejuensis TaxID=904715 RepID=A0ABX0XM51_9SPHN|nr:hypothetical protein [Sphingomonas jejuensis]NJC34453.1 hypothetical protein [Sphingomonas jejuensis]
MSMPVIAAALALAPVQVAAQPAATVPVAPAMVVDGMRACASAVSSSGVDTARLQAAGYAAGALGSDQASADTGMSFYGKAGSAVTLVVMPSPVAMCVAMAETLGEDGREPVRAALATVYGEPADHNGNSVWRAGDQQIVLTAGEADGGPALRVAVLNENAAVHMGSNQ